MVKKKELYETLIDRDGLICGLCGEGLSEAYERLLQWRIDFVGKRKEINIDIDHIIPWSKIRNGTKFEDITNLQLAHRTCNQSKRDGLPLGQMSLSSIRKALKSAHIPIKVKNK